MVVVEAKTEKARASEMVAAQLEREGNRIYGAHFAVGGAARATNDRLDLFCFHMVRIFRSVNAIGSSSASVVDDLPLFIHQHHAGTCATFWRQAPHGFPHHRFAAGTRIWFPSWATARKMAVRSAQLHKPIHGGCGSPPKTKTSKRASLGGVISCVAEMVAAQQGVSGERGS